MKKYCKFCKRPIKYVNWRTYAAHCGNCKLNTTRQHSNKARCGKKMSNEFILKCIIAKKGINNPMYGMKGKLSPNFGSKRTIDSKLKMSIIKKGNKNHRFGKRKSQMYFDEN